METYYTVYKTQNKINGKFYIGCHKTIDPNDNYLGSGKILKSAIQKYGEDNFSKEILHNFDNPEDMFSKEAEIVNEDFVKDPMTYNLKIGGFGGFDFINQNMTKEKRIELGKISGPITIKNNGKNNWKPNTGYSFKGKKHSDETKKKMSESARNRVGNGLGMMWITNGEITKKIKKDERIPEGFVKGRKYHALINAADS